MIQNAEEILLAASESLRSVIPFVFRRLDPKQ